MTVPVTVEDTILVEVFGSSPETRIISFFMDFPLNDFMQKEVCEATGLNPRTVRGRLSKLKEKGIIMETRKVGKATLYTLNREGHVVRRIEDMIRSISMGVALAEHRVGDRATVVTAGPLPPDKSSEKPHIRPDRSDSSKQT